METPPAEESSASSVNANHVVFEHQFTKPEPVELAIVRNVLTLSEGNFGVTDMNGNVIFKIKGKVISIRDRRTLVDASNNPICTLRPVIMSVHDRWQAFKGDSVEDKDIIFTVKRSALIQFKTKLYVALACNPKTEHSCDYRVEGNWREKACVIYAGKSDTVVAKMQKKRTVESMVLGKDNFMVTVEPNVDYAFIVALIAILDGINNEDE